jgi:transcriptional regulator with XRE-family HTH domain
LTCLADRIRSARQCSGWTLDQLADRAGISKTYLWELEKDEAGEKRPSADVLGRLAYTLGLTLAELIGHPTVEVDGRAVELPPGLVEFDERMNAMGERLNREELIDLMGTRFRGRGPGNADEWHLLYLIAKGWGRQL